MNTKKLLQLDDAFLEHGLEYVISLYMMLDFLSPGNEPVDSSVWNQIAMNTTQVLGLVWWFPKGMWS